MWKVERLLDQMPFALKLIEPESLTEYQAGINEINLMSFVDCDQMIKFQEAFYY